MPDAISTNVERSIGRGTKRVHHSLNRGRAMMVCLHGEQQNKQGIDGDGQPGRSGGAAIDRARNEHAVLRIPSGM